MKAKIIIPTGYRKLATGLYVETGDYCLQATINGCAIELEWKQSTNVNFPWRVTHNVFVIRPRSTLRSRPNQRITRKG